MHGRDLAHVAICHRGRVFLLHSEHAVVVVHQLARHGGRLARRKHEEHGEGLLHGDGSGGEILHNTS